MNAARDSREISRASALGKIAAVVNAVANESRLTKIASAAELPASTVHRILQQLIEVGWVGIDDERQYVLGSQLLALGARASQATTLLRIVDPILRELRDATGHTVHLSVRHLDEMVYVAKLHGLRAYQMRSHIGLTIPMHCSAAGKSVLAALPEDEVRSVIARTGLPRRTSHTITDVDQLLKHLNSVRRNGFALDDEENEARVRCVGAAVLHESGVPSAAVSVSSLDIDLRDAGMRRNAALVVAAAHEISGALGAQSLDGGT